MVLLSVLSSLLPQLVQFTLTSLSLVQEDAVTALLDQAPCPSDDERMKVYHSYCTISPLLFEKQIECNAFLVSNNTYNYVEDRTIEMTT